MDDAVLGREPGGISCISFAIKLGKRMLRWALIFLVVALVAGLLGFTNVAGTSMAIAQTLFYVFIVIFVVMLVISLITGRRPPV